jgi:hypothetical protein
MVKCHFLTGHYVTLPPLYPNYLEYARDKGDDAEQAYRSDLQTGEIIEERNLCKVSAVYCAR